MVDSILETIRGAVSLDEKDNSFDTELLLHINSALSILNQNGVGNPIIVSGIEATWDDFKNPSQLQTDYMFESAKLYIFAKVKILFDPPPPSTGTFMQASIDEILWRLRESYDLSIVKEEIE